MVIAILGILAAIAVPRISGFTASARVSADKSNATLIHNAIQIYMTDNTTIPGAAFALGAGTATDVNAITAVLVTAGFLPNPTTITFNDYTKLTYTAGGTFTYTP